MDGTSLAWLSWGLGIGTILQVGEKGPTCFIFLLVWVLFFISSKNLVKVELLAGCGIPDWSWRLLPVQGAVSPPCPWLVSL